MKVHKFVDPVIPKQMSAIDHSIGPQKGAKDVRNAFKAYLNGPAATIQSQNQ